ncbi:MAG TPA: peptide-methionine (R)-S-oxide reductase MsrB [Catalimonadaceae bacterium]|nr:peptide-methionine (R)-S-oxide reductase MsrB [Catalimonadaceae bacterium]
MNSEKNANADAASAQAGSNPYYSRTDTTSIQVPDSVWKKILKPDVYHIAREKGTESRFTGKLWQSETLGMYYCLPCGNPLFKSDSKFSSTCGWPSFFETLRKNSVVYLPDHSHGMVRTEVQCGRCGAHLGHVFDDGPPPTGKRFCMNSIVLDFEPDGAIPGQ